MQYILLRLAALLSVTFVGFIYVAAFGCGLFIFVAV